MPKSPRPSSLMSVKLEEKYEAFDTESGAGKKDEPVDGTVDEATENEAEAGGSVEQREAASVDAAFEAAELSVLSATSSSTIG